MKLRSISSAPPPKCEQAMVDSVLKIDAIWRTLRNGYHSQIAKWWFKRKGRSLIEKITTGKIDKHDDSTVMQYSPHNKYFSGADNLDLVWGFCRWLRCRRFAQRLDRNKCCASDLRRSPS
jgi:hypothetical protein